MKILVINLDRSPERLQRMASLLAGLHLQFDRVAAVDGRALSKAEMRGWVHEMGHFYRLRAGEIGCFLSHRKCWEIAARGAPGEFTIVLEDDIIFGRNAGEILSTSGWIPADADIIKLETNLHRTYTDRAPAASVSARKIVRLRAAHVNAAAYAISSGAAKRLLTMSESFCDPVDHFLFDPVSPAFRELVIYQLTPAVYVQDGNASNPTLVASDSTLHQERRENRRTGIAKLRRELERPFEQGAALLRGWCTNLVRRQKWGRIPFE